MSIIELSKLRRNTTIIVETENSIFEIVVTGPKGGSVVVTGGKTFVRPTKSSFIGCIQENGFIEGKIEKDGRMQFIHQVPADNTEKTVITSRVTAATIYANDSSWKYDAIE